MYETIISEITMAPVAVQWKLKTTINPNEAKLESRFIKLHESAAFQRDALIKYFSNLTNLEALHVIAIKHIKGFFVLEVDLARFQIAYDDANPDEMNGLPFISF